MIVALEWISGVLVLLGGVFCVTGAVGIYRFPDFYTRMHASGVSDTLGAGLVFLGLMVASLARMDAGVVPSLLMVFKLFFILFFLWMTGSTACHALARAAWLDGLKPWTAKGGDPSNS